jgi:hypothetical protein
MALNQCSQQPLDGSLGSKKSLTHHKIVLPAIFLVLFHYPFQLISASKYESKSYILLIDFPSFIRVEDEELIEEIERY